MLKILVVDDSKSAQLKICEILSQFGDCTQAYNGAEAVDYFSNALTTDAFFDLVIMDIVMPEMDGFEAAREILAMEDKFNIPQNQKAKIVMLTSKADPKHMIKAQFEIGITNYITKPFEERTLVETLYNMGLFDTEEE